LTLLITGHPEHTLTADAHLARGMCLRQEGKHAEAIRDIDAYLATNPDVPKKCDALYERGLAEVSLEKYTDAASTFQQVLDADAKYANADKVLYELGWAHKSAGDESKEPEAVAAFSKLAATYPDSPLAAEANFHVAESHYDADEFAEAVKAYTVAMEKSTAKDLGEKAGYKLGWAQYQLKDYPAAFAAFSQQVEDYPEGALRADGLFMKAECLFRQEDYEQALPAYLATQDAKLSSATIEVLADLHGGQSASQLENWKQAIALLARIPERHADSPYLAEAYYELGWAKQNSDQEEEALKDYEQAASASRGVVGARARFMIGELYFGKKEFPEAIRQFQRVMFGYGGENAPDEVKKWQVKAGFEAARCSEVQIEKSKGAARTKLISDAKRDYGFVVDKAPEDELAPKAKERLEALSKLR
jgi:TolA-binding protein